MVCTNKCEFPVRVRKRLSEGSASGIRHTKFGSALRRCFSSVHWYSDRRWRHLPLLSLDYGGQGHRRPVRVASERRAAAQDLGGLCSVSTRRTSVGRCRAASSIAAAAVAIAGKPSDTRTGLGAASAARSPLRAPSLAPAAAAASVLLVARARCATCARATTQNLGRHVQLELNDNERCYCTSVV